MFAVAPIRIASAASVSATDTDSAGLDSTSTPEMPSARGPSVTASNSARVAGDTV